MREPVEACRRHGRRREAVEDMLETGKGSEGVHGRARRGPEEVGKAVGESRRGGKAREGLLCYIYRLTIFMLCMQPLIFDRAFDSINIITFASCFQISCLF